LSAGCFSGCFSGCSNEASVIRGLASIAPTFLDASTLFAATARLSCFSKSSSRGSPIQAILPSRADDHRGGQLVPAGGAIQSLDIERSSSYATV